MKINRFLITAGLIALASSALIAENSVPRGYVSLFDGETMKGWYTEPENTQEIWKIDPKQGIIGRDVRSGYLWTTRKYSDFVLQMEFKMSRNCNSGLFFRTDPKNPVQRGFEIQLFDTPQDAEMDKHSIGALYDAQAASKNTLNERNKWNKIKLSVQGNLIKVWINDVLVNEADLSNWTKAEKNPDGTKNKFRTALNDLPKTGHIGIQDHGHNIWLRNIFIKEL